MTTVVIVDDQPMVRDGLRLILELADIDVVGEASDGDEGAELVLALTPDVVLMDVMMSPVGGLEATRRIVEARCRSRVLILTTFDLDSHVYEALQVGAAGFLLRTSHPRGWSGRWSRRQLARRRCLGRCCADSWTTSYAVRPSRSRLRPSRH